MNGAASMHLCHVMKDLSEYHDLKTGVMGKH